MNLATVCAVVLNWNGWSDTLECLNSLRPLMGKELTTVVVVDNCSTDDSLARIGAWMNQQDFRQVVLPDAAGQLTPELPEAVLLKSSSNRGFAGGNNVGLRYMLEQQQYDYVWLLNNDTTVDISAVKELVAFAVSSPQVGIVGSTILEYYTPGVVQCGGGATYNPLTTVNTLVMKGSPATAITAQSEETTFSYICGASMFIPTRVLERVGLLNEEYFLYYEEIDYAIRVQRQGFTLGWCRSSFVYHKAGATAGSVSIVNQRKSTLSEYHSNRSALLFTRKYYPRLFPLMALMRFGLKCCWFLAARKWYLFPALWNAYSTYLRKGGDPPLLFY